MLLAQQGLTTHVVGAHEDDTPIGVVPAGRREITLHNGLAPSLASRAGALEAMAKSAIKEASETYSA